MLFIALYRSLPAGLTPLERVGGTARSGAGPSEGLGKSARRRDAGRDRTDLPATAKTSAVVRHWRKGLGYWLPCVTKPTLPSSSPGKAVTSATRAPTGPLREASTIAATSSAEPVTSASTLPSGRFRTQPRNPRPFAVRTAQCR